MKKYKIAVIPGDGIGVEVVSSALEVLTHVSKNKDFCSWLDSFLFSNS